MSRLRHVLNWASVVLFIAMLIVAFFAPNAQSDDYWINVHSFWGRVWLGLVIAIFVLAFARGYLRRMNVKELEAASWPDAPVAVSEDAPVHFDEYTIRFEESTHSWVFTADGKAIGAFRQIEGDLGEELNVLGERFTIDGNLLQKDGEKIAEGKQTMMSMSPLIITGGTTYTIRQKSFNVFKTDYRMTGGESLDILIQRQHGGDWTVTGARNIDAVIVVFAYWLIAKRQID